MRKIPKFIYHGTTSRAYENIKKSDYSIFQKLECTDNVGTGIGYALKRARQREDNPVLLVLNSIKHNVRKEMVYLVTGKLDPQGHLMISLYNLCDKELYANQYKFLSFVQHSAHKLEDFLEGEPNDK